MGGEWRPAGLFRLLATRIEEINMTTAASRPAKLAESVMPTDKSAEAALDKTVDYNDEVTAEQMVELDRAFAHLDMNKWKAKSGPAW